MKDWIIYFCRLTYVRLCVNCLAILSLSFPIFKIATITEYKVHVDLRVIHLSIIDRSLGVQHNLLVPLTSHQKGKKNTINYTMSVHGASRSKEKFEFELEPFRRGERALVHGYLI